MGTLKINCQLSELEISDILEDVERKLYANNPVDIQDYDDEIHNVRIYVEYDCYLDTISIKTSEILNSDWEVLYEDTAVFTSRLKVIVDNYNQENLQLYNQSVEVQNDRREYSYKI